MIWLRLQFVYLAYAILCPFAPAVVGTPLGLSQSRIAPSTEPIVTDRPDFTEATATVPWGHVQLEGGYTFTYDDERGHRVSEQTVPEFLLRVGLSDSLELRTGWTGMSLTEDLFVERNDAGRRVHREVHDDGGADLTTGVKLLLQKQNGLRPELSVIGELSLPTGTDSKSSRDVDPQVKGLWSYELTERLGVAGNINLGLPTEESRFVQTSASISLGARLTDRLTTYVEYFGFYPNHPGSDCAHYVDGGVALQINSNLQLDFRIGAGLNEEADDVFTGVGFAIRW